MWAVQTMSICCEWKLLFLNFKDVCLLCWPGHSSHTTLWHRVTCVEIFWSEAFTATLTHLQTLSTSVDRLVPEPWEIQPKEKRPKITEKLDWQHVCGGFTLICRWGWVKFELSGLLSFFEATDGSGSLQWKRGWGRTASKTVLFTLKGLSKDPFISGARWTTEGFPAQILCSSWLVCGI